MNELQFGFFYAAILTIYIFWTLENKVFKVQYENDKLKKEIEKLKNK